MRYLLCTLILLIRLTLFSQGFYYQYQLRNVIQLQSDMGIRTYISGIPAKSYRTNKKDSREIEKVRMSIITEEVLNGTSDDAYFFYSLSSPLTGRELNSGVSREDIDTVVRWWRDNVRYVSRDFMKDLIYYINPYYDSMIFYQGDFICDHRIPARLNERIRYRKSKTVFCDDDNIVIDSIKQGIKRDLLSDQNILQDLFNSDEGRYSSVDAVIPRGTGARYVYITRKLMDRDEYDFESAITRKEFEDMMDWWFVNGCNIDLSEIERLNYEWYQRKVEYFENIYKNQ